MAGIFLTGLGATCCLAVVVLASQSLHGRNMSQDRCVNRPIKTQSTKGVADVEYVQTKAGFRLSAEFRNPQGLVALFIAGQSLGFSAYIAIGALITDEELFMKAVGFLLIGTPAAMWAALVLAVLYYQLCPFFGRVTVAVTDEIGEVFTGVGVIGKKQQFDWASVKGVREVAGKWNDPNGSGFGIGLVGPQRIEFGRGSLSSAQREFFIAALNEQLAAAGSIPTKAIA